MKKTVALLTLIISLGLLPGAQAANESIDLSLEATPSAGTLFKEVHRPVDASLTVTVSNPPSEPTIMPLKVANVTFPRDMDFFPNEEKTPACPASKLNDQSNLAAGVAATVALCPNSVVGTGTAVVQIAQNKGSEPIPTVTDPRLVIFNAGRNKQGRPKIVIYGYSKIVQAGLLMHGTLANNGELRIEIGVMPYDSSVSKFTLGIPGEPLVVDESPGTEKSTVQGLDPQYLRGKCSTGVWRATGSFVLGTRTHPGGQPISDDFFVDSNPFELPCKGAVGKAKLKIGKIVGPKTAKAGRKASFLVKVKNAGTATAKSLRLTASGAAKGTAVPGSLAPGGSRKVRIAVRPSARGKQTLVRFVARASGVTAASSSRKITIRKG